MTVAGTGTLAIIATATLTSAGKTLTGGLTFGTATQTCTFADNWTVNGTVTFANVVATTTLNGNTLYCSGGMTHANGNSVTGTTIINFNGTGTWVNGGTAYMANSVTINTAGTLTISSINLSGGTFTYTAGTVNVTAATTAFFNGTITLNVASINFVNIYFQGTFTYTLSANITCTGNLTIGNSGSPTINGNTINVGGSLATVNNASSLGTSIINMNGTGSLTTPNYPNASIRNPLTINTAGTITVTNTSTFGYCSNTLTYTAGTVVTTGSTVGFFNSPTLNCASINWNNVVLDGASTMTLSANLNILGNLTINAANVINGNQVNLGGSLTIGNTVLTGSTLLNINGTGTWSVSSGTGSIGVDMTINTAGTFTISGQVDFHNGKTLTYTTGTVVTTGSTLNLFNSGNRTFNTSGITWNDVNIKTGAAVITLNSLFSVAGTITSTATFSFAGTAGFTCANFTCVTAAKTITFKAGVTYTVTTALTLTGVGNSTNRVFFVSSTPSSSYFFNLQSGASCNVQFVSATDADSSGGRVITDVKGTLLRTVNWYANNPDLYELFQ